MNILTALKCRYLLFMLLFSVAAMAQEKTDTSKIMSVKYGNKGIELRTRDNRFLFQLQSRLQFRFATPVDADPVTFDDFNVNRTNTFKINRARLKVGGHAFKPWLSYYWEYELSQSNLLDFRIMVEKYEWLSVKIGQWKTEFTRERFISSGEQQMIDRSFINRPFTVDRQQGAELYGHLKGKGIADFNYWVAALTGTGRGNSVNDDKNLMYFARGQWNFLGRFLEFESCDLEYHEKPTAIFAVSALTNRSPYTRFSQSGGGSLEGFNADTAGRYRVKQLNLETAFMYKGFSWQSEWSHKFIYDKLRNDSLTYMRGYYVQGGYFFHYMFDWFPKKLEIAARQAVYKPDVDIRENLQYESSFAFNWFFQGHKNKMTAEVSHFGYQDNNLPLREGWRFRIQLDISL